MFRLRSYERISVAISLQRGPVDPKFHIEWVAPTNYSSSQKTRLNDFSYDIKIWTDLSSVLSQSTRLTDGQTEFSSLGRVYIPCSAVKIEVTWSQDNAPDHTLVIALAAVHTTECRL